MKRIGILYGMENTFPSALIERINSSGTKDVVAEHMKVGAPQMAQASGYDLIIDRVSQDVEFYRAFLKNAALCGTLVINDPFAWNSDNRFFYYSLAAKLGIVVPAAVILPHKNLPPGTSGQTFRNLQFPLQWDEVFGYVKFPAFLKPFNGGGWRNTHLVHSREEFFCAYDESGIVCMMLQGQVKAAEYYRCYVVGQQNVRVIRYDPTLPHTERYARHTEVSSRASGDKMRADAILLCRGLGFEINCVEFAIQDGVPYAIDFLNPIPAGDEYTIGKENVEWLVDAVAEMAIERVTNGAKPVEQSWSRLVNENQPRTVSV